RREPAEAVRGARIGVPRQYFWEAEPEVAALVRAAIGELRALGAEIREIDLPPELSDDLFDSGYRAVQRSEASFYHTAMGWYPARADRYSPAVRDALAAGAQMLATTYLAGQRVRRAFSAQMRALLSDLDALAMPTLPIVAPRIATLDEPLRLGAREVTVSYAT